jgi:hypothetical protein
MFSLIHIIPEHPDYVPPPEVTDELIALLMYPEPMGLTVYERFDEFDHEERGEKVLDCMHPPAPLAASVFSSHPGRCVHVTYHQSAWVNQNRRIDVLQDAKCCLWTPAIGVGRQTYYEITSDGPEFKTSFRLTFCGDGFPVDPWQFIDRFRNSGVFREILDVLEPRTKVGWRAMFCSDI